MRTIILALFLALVGCSNSNPVTSDTDVQTAVRPVQTVKLALLSLHQGFNDLDRYVVSGTIKNVSDTGISGISVNVKLKTSAGALIVEENTDPEFGRFRDLSPQGETTFEAEIWRFQLNGETPDPARTEIDILIDGSTVAYHDLRPTGQNYHDLFDFRFSNWGDDEETVASNEPGWFELHHISGGKSTKVSYGWATGVLTFSDSVVDTVEVTYEFHGGLLVAGYYDFDTSVPASRLDTIKGELDERYGASAIVNGYATWNTGHTRITLFPATDEWGIGISYVDVNAPPTTDAEDEYNQLPLRVVVPDR